MAAGQLCWPPAIMFYRWCFFLFSPLNLGDRLTDRHQTLPHSATGTRTVKMQLHFVELATCILWQTRTWTAITATSFWQISGVDDWTRLVYRYIPVCNAIASFSTLSSLHNPPVAVAELLPVVEWKAFPQAYAKSRLRYAERNAGVTFCCNATTEVSFWRKSIFWRNCFWFGGGVVFYY